MIITPEKLIKQYFPEPVETTKDLYDHLGLQEYGYSYSNWLKDLEDHCLSRYFNESDYKLLPDSEKNYWISQKAFMTIIQCSPSKICDEIRKCIWELSKRVASDPAFARELQNQYDREAGIEKVKPKASNKLKLKYNELGQDVFEFIVQADKRLYMDIISTYDFQPEQKIKDALFNLKLESEDGVPYHVVDITLTLTNEHTFTYRDIWVCDDIRSRYAAILTHRIIRINLFADNKRLFSTFDYIVGKPELKSLESDLEKAISMIIDLNGKAIDLSVLREQLLDKHKLS